MVSAFKIGVPSLFGKKLMGADRRRMSLNQGVSYGVYHNVAHLSFSGSRSAKWLDHLIKDSAAELDRGHTDPVTYWGESEFLIVSKDHAAVSAIEKFITSGDAMMTLSTEGLGVGLIIHSISNLPAEVRTGMVLIDESHDRLDVAVKKQDAAGMLNKHGLKYFALSPRWSNDEKEIKYWLNPYDQKQNNAGWYTFDELKLWTEGKGPIPIKDTTKEQ